MAHTSETLQQAIQQLPPLDGVSFWDKKRSELRQAILSSSPDEFLTWSTVISTMFVGNAPYIEQELEALPAYYTVAIREPGFGKPLLHPGGSSGNLIHQAYHLYRWSLATGKSVKDMRRIVEVGGGYGAMALLVIRLGFQGTYQIIDLPEFALLQQYYLSNVLPGNRQIIWDRWPVECDLLIASHSLSEMPFAKRADILTGISAKSYLLVYHCEHEGIDNLSYFAEFAASRPDYVWQGWKTEQPSNQQYLIGVR